MRRTIDTRTAIIHAFIHDLKIPLAVIELGVRSLRQPAARSHLSAPQVERLDAIARHQSAAKDLANRLLSAARQQYPASALGAAATGTWFRRLKQRFFRKSGSGRALEDPLSALQRRLLRIQAHLLAFKAAPSADERLAAQHLNVIDRSLRNCRSALKLVASATRLLGSERLQIHLEAVVLGDAIVRALIDVWELRSEAIFSGLGKSACLAQVQSMGGQDGVVVAVDDRLWRRPFQVDGERVNQILVNLLLNAYKHRRRRITIGAGIEADHLHLSIADDGDGIAPAEAMAPPGTPDLPSAPEVSIAGHGIGLFLVQVILAEINGRMTVHSSPGKGATFTVILPCQPPALAQPG